MYIIRRFALFIYSYLARIVLILFIIVSTVVNLLRGGVFLFIFALLIINYKIQVDNKLYCYIPKTGTVECLRPVLPHGGEAKFSPLKVVLF